MTARYLKFKPQDGIAVLARGRIDLYDARGEVQFVVEAMEPQGHGALQLAFEQLKKKLAAEGLFDHGSQTAAAGAAGADRDRDFADRRGDSRHFADSGAPFPGPSRPDLSGAGARRRRDRNRWSRGSNISADRGWAEVVIVARGGGSLEDLWTFNEERVARAIAACSVPVISAVGHETDFTIADFVADLRAPTPSAAAELVICTRQSLRRIVSRLRRSSCGRRCGLALALLAPAVARAGGGSGHVASRHRQADAARG